MRKEIETAGRLPFTGIINNSNLGVQTTAEDVLSSVDFANEVSALTGLPVVMTCFEKRLSKELSEKVENPFVLTLQRRPV